MSDYKKIIAKNRRALFEYSIEEHFEAGIVLKGSELKSIRAGNVSIADSHAAETAGEVYLYNCHIAEYDKASHFNHDTKRPRKLLLRTKEIKKIIGKIKLKGYTLVALGLYFNQKNRVKIDLGLAKGKKQHDKRQAIKDRDWNREQDRIIRDK